MSQRQFHAVPETTGRPHVKKFALITSSPFLCALSSSPQTVQGAKIALTAANYTLFQDLSRESTKIAAVVKSLGSRRAQKDTMVEVNLA